jgi:hypothetical protein
MALALAVLVYGLTTTRRVASEEDFERSELL